MKTISYQLTTLSSLIVSPRSALAFYKGLGEFSADELQGDSLYLKKENLKIIYPFYQYGTYTAYNPGNAEYYLPGSSIKGALCQGTAAAGSLMADDILVPNDFITLRNLFKAQYLEDSQNARFEEFFDYVGVEMIPAKSELKGEFRLDDSKASHALLSAANESTRVRIKQMKEYLGELLKREYREDLLKILKDADEKLSSYLMDTQVFLLGGYKGLCHSIEVSGSLQETKGAVFLDPQTMLPHGLVKIELGSI